MSSEGYCFGGIIIIILRIRSERENHINYTIFYVTSNIGILWLLMRSKRKRKKRKEKNHARINTLPNDYIMCVYTHTHTLPCGGGGGEKKRNLRPLTASDRE